MSEGHLVDPTPATSRLIIEPKCPGEHPLFGVVNTSGFMLVPRHSP
jgi:hypothetical protein